MYIVSAYDIEFFSPRHKTLRTASNKLVINLAFSNAIMHIKSWVIIVNGLHGGPILGDFGKAYYIYLSIFKNYCYLSKSSYYKQDIKKREVVTKNDFVFRIFFINF